MPTNGRRTNRRSRQRATVEEMSAGALDANELLRMNMFAGEPSCWRSLRWPSVAHISAARYMLVVKHAGRTLPQNVRVSWTRCHFGGERPWLHCACGRRVGKLLPSLGGFLCRQCLGNPMYACQSASSGGRKHFAVAKLRLQLGGSAALTEPQPKKPLRMHKAKFRRLKSKLDEMEAQLSPRVKARSPDYRSLVVAARY